MQLDNRKLYLFLAEVNYKELQKKKKIKKPFRPYTFYIIFYNIFNDRKYAHYLMLH